MQNTTDDQQLLTQIIAATQGRPALATVHAAAMALSDVDGVMDEIVVDGVVEPDYVGPDYVGPVDPGVDTVFTDSGVPTFDAVRERVDMRSGTADGQRVLDGSSQEELFEARAELARTKLDEIRKSMRE